MQAYGTVKACVGVAGVLGVEAEEDLLFGVLGAAFDLDDDGVLEPRPYERALPGVRDAGSSLFASKLSLISSHLLVRLLRKYTAMS